MKPRFNIYVSDTNAARVVALNKQTGRSLTSIFDTALDDYFAGVRDDERDAAIVRRLDRLTRQFDRLEHKDTVLGETLALFIRYFLMVTPQLPADQLDAARAKGEQQFGQFVEQLGRDLQSGKRMLQRAVDDVIADASDFFTEDELERLHNPAPVRASKKEAGHA